MVLIALSCPMAFADGEMGGGGLYDSGNGSNIEKTVIIRTSESDGEMGGGGRSSGAGYLESVMTSLYDYLNWVI